MATIVWIRRSLRVEDNTALAAASEENEDVIPFYVIDDGYFSGATLGYPRVKFWREALRDLKRRLQEQGSDLVIRKGNPTQELEKIVEEVGADSIYFNRDYSPYSKRRDEKTLELDVEVKSFKDTVMFEKEEILTNSGDPYKVYSYYRDKWFEREKPKPRKNDDFSTPEIGSEKVPELEELGFEEPELMEWRWNPSREGALKRLEKFKDKITDYSELRDYPAKEATSRLSPHLKFGTVSIREVFWESERMKARKENEEGIETWQEQLVWRDFYFQLMWNYPHCVEKPFREIYENISWRSQKQAREDWKRFIEGRTGFPFIDAGMRQLKREGWMHNRARMTVTSFACKDLWIDWKLLHNYFKRMFIDAELSLMVGGIQWAYSIGTDAQPYFRVFNPWTQGEKFDPEGEFIRKMIPELEEVPEKYVHEPYKMPEKVQRDSGCIIGEDYPAPIVDHDERRKEAIKRFEEVRENNS